MADHQHHTQPYPTRPRQRPQQAKPNKTQEANFWKAYKTQEITGLTSSITHLTFSPTHPHHFATTHSTSLSLYNPHHPFSPLDPVSSTSAFKDVAFSPTYRCDGLLLAAGCGNGVVKVFEGGNVRKSLRELKGHGGRGVRVVRYPSVGDKLHLVSGGDDGGVRYWDVASECVVQRFDGHKDYVRGGGFSPVDDSLFVSGGYDHAVRVWDVRSNKEVVSVSHGSPVESVVVLPGGGLVATSGGSVVKVWDLIGGGRCVGSMEGHNKTVTALCVGRVGRESGEESGEWRVMSVGLDGYLKVFDYAKMKVTFSMRFPAPLMSVGLSPDGSTRVIGTSNGSIYMGQRKKGKGVEEEDGFGFGERPERRAVRPGSVRYFHRGQNEKPREGEHVIAKPKKVKLAEHDKLLRKFRHKEALVAALRKKNPDYVVAVMEELVARRKLFKCVSNLDGEELELLLIFLKKYTAGPRYGSLLMPFATKVVQLRAEDIRTSDALKGLIRNLKRSIQEELRIQQSLLEIQGVLSPMMRIAGR